MSIEKIHGSLKKNTTMITLIHNHLVKEGKISDLGNIIMPEIPDRKQRLRVPHTTSYTALPSEEAEPEMPVVKQKPKILMKKTSHSRVHSEKKSLNDMSSLYYRNDDLLNYGLEKRMSHLHSAKKFLSRQ